FVAAAPNHELAPAARRMITETLARSGDRSEMQDAYKALMEQTPPTPEALYDAASLAGRLGRPSDQEAAWRRLRKEFPDHALAARAALDLANAAFKRKDWKEAAAQANAAARSSEDGVRAEALGLAGESELKLGRHSVAAKAFEAVGGVKNVEAGVRHRGLARAGRDRAPARPAAARSHPARPVRRGAAREAGRRRRRPGAPGGAHRVAAVPARDGRGAVGRQAYPHARPPGTARVHGRVLR